ncbi:unnamed protein product, partial [marine sediment metagenome]
FALFSSNWLVSNCNDPNWCDHTDIDTDGDVDVYDLTAFVDYWLWDVSYVRPPRIPEDPNIIYCQKDPNIIYSIVDANGLSDITMDVNDVVTLYIDMQTFGRDMQIFSIEVHISDPNLGSIDNTAYDPNDPPGTGTARILAQPRSSGLDYWGHGELQQEGIELFGVSLSGSISDGDLASFVYTCGSDSQVTLEIVNVDSSGSGVSLCPTLVNFTINQVGSAQQESMSSGTSEIFEASQEATTEQMTSDEMVEWLESIWTE